MRPRFVLPALLALLSAGAFGDSPNLNKYSDAELWNAADLVALVRIESGTYIKDIGFDLAASSLEVLKGDSEGSLSIAAHYPLLNVPNQLGSSYLVFLTETDSDQYSLIHEIRSAVRITYVEFDEDMADRMTALRKSDIPENWYSYDGSLWRVECAPAHGHDYFCERERAIVGYAMGRVGGVNGR